MTFATRSLTAAAVVFCAMLTAMGQSSAQAGDWAMITIRNPNDVTLNYQFRWGDTGWDDVAIGPGKYVNHYIELDEFGFAPIPYVRFDCIGGDDDFTAAEYELDFFESDYTGEFAGKRYTFEYTGRMLLDLYEN